MKFIRLLLLIEIFLMLLNVPYHDFTVTLPVFGLCGWIVLCLMFGMICEVVFGDIN